MKQQAGFEKKFLNISNILPYLLGAIMFIEYFDGAALNLIFPELAIAFNVAPTFMKISLTVYLIAEAIFIPISGYFSHKIDLKKLLQLGIFLMMIGSIGCMFSASVTMLIFFRGIQGVSAAFITPICRLFVLKKFDKEDRLKTINKVMGIALIGLIAGPFISAFIVKHYNWSNVFLLFAVFSIVCFFLVEKTIPNYKNTAAEKFDLSGFIILGFSIISFFLFFSFTIKNNDQYYIHVSFLVLSIFFFKKYFSMSKKKSNAIFPAELSENNQFLIGIVSNFIFRVLFGGVIFACSYIMQIQLKYSLLNAAICLSIYGVGMILGKIFIGFFTSNYGYKKTLVLNSIFLGIITILISFEIVLSLNYFFYGTLFLYGLSATLQYSAMNIVNLNDVNHEFQSKANVVLNITRLLGTNFGISLSALFLGMQNISFQSMLLMVFFLYGCIGIFGAWLFNKINI